MSSSGRIRAMTPLLPWRPAILSPTDSLRFMATKTFTSLMTPGGSSSPRFRRLSFSAKRAFKHLDLALGLVDDVGELLLHVFVVPPLDAELEDVGVAQALEDLAGEVLALLQRPCRLGR